MAIRPTSDGVAVIDTTHHWIPVAEASPPLGAKVLLIDRRYGVAVLGIFRKGDKWTHWSPLPRFTDRKSPEG